MTAVSTVVSHRTVTPPALIANVIAHSTLPVAVPSSHLAHSSDSRRPIVTPSPLSRQLPSHGHLSHSGDRRRPIVTPRPLLRQSPSHRHLAHSRDRRRPVVNNRTVTSPALLANVIARSTLKLDPGLRNIPRVRRYCCRRPSPPELADLPGSPEVVPRERNS